MIKCRKRDESKHRPRLMVITKCKALIIGRIVQVSLSRTGYPILSNDRANLIPNTARSSIFQQWLTHCTRVCRQSLQRSASSLHTEGPGFEWRCCKISVIKLEHQVLFEPIQTKVSIPNVKQIDYNLQIQQHRKPLAKVNSLDLSSQLELTQSACHPKHLHSMVESFAYSHRAVAAALHQAMTTACPGKRKCLV